jgi:transposase
MRNKKKFNEMQKNEINEWKTKIEVLDYAAKGYTNKEISDLTGYSQSSVSDLISEYVKNGIGYFVEEHRKGGNHRNMSETEEAEFLERFKGLAEKGQITTIAEIAAAYDAATGKAHESKSTVYYTRKQKHLQKYLLK